MNILYLGFWSIEDGLTSSTIFPNLERLVGYQSIDKIVFSTIERAKEEVHYNGPKSEKIIFEPLYSKNLNLHLLTKIFDFIIFPIKLKKLCRKYKIDKIIARGAPSGALANKVSNKTKFPFIVESFEPHADYMQESGIWSKTSLKYIFEKKWENTVKQNAEEIAVVSHNYAHQLAQEGIDKKKISVVPCCVNLQDFKFNLQKRVEKRNLLKINDQQVAGIYVGKFGGTYYDEETFDIFLEAYNFFEKNLYIIVLTPHPKNDIEQRIEQKGIPKNNFFVNKVPHEEVPHFLSAADFAFSTVRPSPSKKFCSAVKNGEYWANGLPILTTDGIGDDTQIIKETKKGGAVFDFYKNTLPQALIEISSLIKNNSREELNESIRELAIEHRNFSLAHDFYDKIFEN